MARWRFVAALPERLILDEVQRVPELFGAIKLAVHRQRATGRSLMTGSSNLLLVPQLSESFGGLQNAGTGRSSKIWRHPSYRPMLRRPSTAPSGGDGQPDRYRFRSGGIPNWRSVPSSVGGCKRMRSSFSR